MWSVWVASRADTSSSRVAAAGEGSGRAYLNFAKDWHSDFTVLVERKDSEALKSPGIDVKTLAGKRLRVRGWVEWRNGPMIHVTLLEQIELLPAEATPAPQGQEAPPIGAIAL